jgi:23S rRNA pseudouridine2605 synthase
MAEQNEYQDTKPGERVAKVIARSGLCSRREAEALIEDNRVSVNGVLIESAALDISPSDRVLVDGKPLLVREPPRLWRYYKPKGRVTTHKDPEGRPTVFESLPEHLPRLISVGRLDFNTEGLILLTNDGDLARHLELPSTGWTRRYRVRAFGEVSEAQLQELAGGLTVNRMSYGPIEASLEREQGDNVWISISIREGKNREVRRIMEHLGLTVNRLIRISFGPFMLGDLEPGAIEEVKTAVLKDQLGPRLSRQLGVRREVMREERRLAPGRAKPSYLRRKPGPEPRPERPEQPQRPLKRRRIFEQEGSEAPKVEFVAERKPRMNRFDAGGERGEKPRFGGQREDTQSRPRADGALRKGPRPPWQDRDERAAADSKPEGKTEARNYRERPSRSSRDDIAAGERPRFQRPGPERMGEKRPQRRFEGQGQQEDERGQSERPAYRSEGDRPPRRFAAAGEGGEHRGKPREERSERPAGAQRPHRHFEAGSRGPGERRSAPYRNEGERPARRFAAAREESHPGKSGVDRAGRPARPEFRRKPEGERKPQRRFEGASKDASERRSEGSLYRSESDRPPRRFSAAGEGGAHRGKPREERGERPARSEFHRRPEGEQKPQRRFRGERHDAGENRSKRSDAARPPRRFAAAGEGATARDKPREGLSERPPRSESRRKQEGERKPFKAHGTSERGSSRRGSWTPREKRSQEKPSGRTGKPPRREGAAPARKPNFRPRPGTEKETP